MANFSKFFNEHLSTLSCRDFHEGVSCQRHILSSCIYCPLSIMKLFSPIYLFAIIRKYRSLTKEDLKEILLNYKSCIMGCSVTGICCNCILCVFRVLFRKHFLYTLIFIPVWFSAHFIFLCSKTVIEMASTTAYQYFVESLLRRNNVLSKTISGSKSIQTAIFMLCSALILHGKRAFDMKGFWLIKPSPATISEESEDFRRIGCNMHPKLTCGHYLWEGVRNNFLMGLAVDCLRALKRVSNQPLSTKTWTKAMNIRMYWGPLFSLYIGLYRLTHCLLNRVDVAPDKLNHALAACCAGLSHFFYPEMTLFHFAVVQAIAMLWRMFQMCGAGTENKISRALLSFPYTYVLYPLIQAHCVHIHIMRPQLCGTFHITTDNSFTNNYSTTIMNKVQETIKRAKGLQ
uniref:Transmembrane protein 135 N-terminal domain-containing protein n=1 Tax=Glossina austeni TaxID=7395 RepID=A0A1A9UJW9_GLOAU